MSSTLGIHIGHDASVTLLDESGKIILAINEERINRIKSFSGVPINSLKMIPKGKYHIALSNSFEWWANMSKFNFKFYFQDQKKFYDLFNKRKFHFQFGQNQKSALDKLIIILKNNNIYPLSINCFDHHLCHAASSYFTSGFNQSLIVTSDGSGEKYSSKIFIGNKNNITEVHSIKMPSSMGHIYSYVTKHLGFKISRHEGKITGLAAFGKKYKSKLNLFNFKKDNLDIPFLKIQKNFLLKRIVYFFLQKPFYQNFEKFKIYLKKNFPHIKAIDLAYKVQKNLEISVLNYLKYGFSLFRSTNLCLAGGVFSNVKLNQKIADISHIKKIWICPDMGDGGLSLGAALYDLNSREKINNQSLKDAYKGNIQIYKKNILIKILKKNNLKIISETLSYNFVAKLLLEDKIIGLFQGHMEYGPRALGNRTILASPINKNITKLINQKLNRNDFMPFAPCVPNIYAKKIFELNESAKNCYKFMTCTCGVKKNWIKKIPAVVHVDNTARPQIVSQSDNKILYDILINFNKISKVPVLINTSFNLHEEPIVYSYEDAIKSFIRGACDYLIIDGILVKY